MKTAIIIQNKVTLKTDLAALKAPQAYRLLLICSTTCHEQLSASNLELFDQTHITNDFSHPHLCDLIAPYLNDEPSLLTTDEDCMLRTALLRDEFKLPGPGVDIINLFIDKTAMKAHLANSDIRMPKYIKYDHQQFQTRSQQYLEDIIVAVGLPLIVKPVDMAGSKEVVLCHDLKALSNWAVQQHQHGIIYEIDEFIEGDIYHCDALVKNGEIIHVDVSHCILPIMQFLQGKPMGSMPIAHHDPLLERIIAFNKRVINHLPTPDGATHLELFHTNQSELVFLEIAARPSGGHVMQVYQKATNVNFERSHLQLQMGLGVEINMEQKGFAAWVYYPIKPGKVTALLPPKLHSQHQIKWLIKVGDVLQQCRSLFDIALMIELFSEDETTLAKDYQYLRSFKPFSISE